MKCLIGHITRWCVDGCRKRLRCPKELCGGSAARLETSFCPRHTLSCLPAIREMVLRWDEAAWWGNGKEMLWPLPSLFQKKTLAALQPRAGRGESLPCYLFFTPQHTAPPDIRMPLLLEPSVFPPAPSLLSPVHSVLPLDLCSV